MSGLNIEFREKWNEKFSEIPCWTNPKDEKREYRPVKVIYDLEDREKPFQKWVKYMGYQDFVLDFTLAPKYKLAVEIDGKEHKFSEKAATDRRKANLLQILGWRILRYDAHTLQQSTELVYEQILECLLNNFKVPKNIRDKYEDY